MQALPQGGNGKAEDCYFDIITAAKTGNDFVMHDIYSSKDSRVRGKGQGMGISKNIR